MFLHLRSAVLESMKQNSCISLAGGQPYSLPGSAPGRVRPNRRRQGRADDRLSREVENEVGLSGSN